MLHNTRHLWQYSRPPTIFIHSFTIPSDFWLRDKNKATTWKYHNEIRQHTLFIFIPRGGSRGMLRRIHFQTNSISLVYKSNRQNDPNIYSIVTHPSDSTITRQSQKTLVDAFHSGKCFILIIYFDIRLCSSAVVNRDCYYISREKSPPKPLLTIFVLFNGRIMMKAIFRVI